MSDSLRVLIVDDSSDIRDLLRMALSRDERFDIIGEAVDGELGLAAIVEHTPDVVLLDLAMPVLDGLQVLDALQERDAMPCVIVLSGFSSGAPEESALEHGAAGYIEKGLSLRQMGDAIMTIYDEARAGV